MPLWLFGAGLLSGTQFSLHNHPSVLIVGYAVYYTAILSSTSSLRTTLAYSFMFGYGFFCYSHSWISHPLTAFGDMYASLQPFVFVCVPAILAGYFVIIGTVHFFIKKHNAWHPLKLSLITLCTEYIRCEYAPAVPLGQVGSLWITYPYISQSAAVFGIYGLSLFTLFLSYSIGFIQRSKIPVIGATCIGIAMFTWGAWRIESTQLTLSEGLVRVVPTAWKQTDRFQSLETRSAHLRYLVDQSASNSNSPTILILWPETTIEFALLDIGNGYDFMYPGIKNYILNTLPPKSTLLAGVVMRTPNNEAYNIVFALNKDQDIYYVYKKRLLAPFGEFMPSFLKDLTKALGIQALDDFNRGQRPQDQLVLTNGLTINPIICYEGSFTGQSIMPYQSTDLITVSTNDAWFRYNGKEQQFISHAFRAIEEGVAIIRCANSGFSGYVSPLGTYTVSLSEKPREFLFHKPLPTPPYRWLVNHLPYWLEILFLLSLLYLIFSEVSYRQRRSA